MAENAQGERVQESVPVDWPCRHAYFFGDCPEGKSVCVLLDDGRAR